MKRIFVDTGAWYALADKKDPDHTKAKASFESNTIPFITTHFVFDEAITLIMSRLGWSVGAAFGEGLKKSSFATIAVVTNGDEEKAWEIFLKYKDAGFSYTDCTSFAVMRRLKIDTAFAFDEHFKILGFALA